MATALDKIAGDRQLSDSNFPSEITVRDLAKLQPNKWLNDNVSCCKRASEMIHIGNVLVLTAHQCSIMFMRDRCLPQGIIIFITNCSLQTTTLF